MQRCQTSRTFTEEVTIHEYTRKTLKQSSCYLVFDSCVLEDRFPRREHPIGVRTEPKPIKQK
jgi:hypothetical protein